MQARQFIVFPLLLLSLICLPGYTECARILGVWPMAAPSHFFLGERLLKELAAQGHDVTMVSYFPQKEKVKNYRDIALNLTEAQEALAKNFPKDKKFNLLDFGNLPVFLQIYTTGTIGNLATEVVFENNDFQKLLNDKNEKFDLVIFEMFYTEILYGLGHQYNCPVIILSTIGSTIWTNHLVSNPAPSAYNPDTFTSFSSHMNFLERLYTFSLHLANEIYRKYFYFPKLNNVMHQVFHDEKMPDLETLMYNKTAMILLNSHPSFSDAKPHVPAMVEIGGFHLKEAKPLPEDLKKFMDSAKNGVIFFSMGSNLKSTDLHEDKRKIIMNVFSKLKQEIIWKFEDENLEGKPSNVKIMKWCPQNDIMAHPNLKLFITHGGLLSTTEAVYHGVPVIGIPIFGDQRLNVAMTKRKGFGVGVNYNDLTEESLTKALDEILNNPSYKINAKKASQLLRDQPVKPLDAAVFWVNHVLKHKGADHLRTAAMDLSWYQLYSVDLVIFFVVLDIVLFIGFYLIIKWILGHKKNKKKDAGKKKKN